MNTYRCIVADPPWPQQKRGTLRGREGWHDSHGASQEMRYTTMPVEHIAALPVGELAHPDGCHLYLWTTNRFLEDAYQVARTWGFKPSTLLVWAKNPMGGGLGGAYGISTEFIVYARRGRLAERERVRGTWFNWKRPYDERGKPMHSAKPSEFYAMAEKVGHAPRLELFARRARDGWDVWGDEAPGAVVLPVPGWKRSVKIRPGSKSETVGDPQQVNTTSGSARVARCAYGARHASRQIPVLDRGAGRSGHRQVPRHDPALVPRRAPQGAGDRNVPGPGRAVAHPPGCDQ